MGDKKHHSYFIFKIYSLFVYFHLYWRVDSKKVNRKQTEGCISDVLLGSLVRIEAMWLCGLNHSAVETLHHCLLL